MPGHDDKSTVMLERFVYPMTQHHILGQLTPWQHCVGNLKSCFICVSNTQGCLLNNKVFMISLVVCPSFGSILRRTAVPMSGAVWCRTEMWPPMPRNMRRMHARTYTHGVQREMWEDTDLRTQVLVTGECF